MEIAQAVDCATRTTTSLIARILTLIHSHASMTWIAECCYTLLSLIEFTRGLWTLDLYISNDVKVQVKVPDVTEVGGWEKQLC